MKQISSVFARNKIDLGLLILFLSATLVWLIPFFSRSSVGLLDWQKEAFYFETLKASLTSGNGIPLVFNEIPAGLSWYPTLAASNSYFGNPETLLFSPFLFLAALPLKSFFYSYLYIHFIIAGVGVILIRRAISMNVLAAFTLFLGAFLAPWIMQHVLIGFTPWLTLCWLPLSAYFVLKRKFIIAGMTLSLVIYEGGFHVFIWTLMAGATWAIIFLAFSRKSWSLWIARALLWSVLFSLPRLVAIYASNQQVGPRKLVGSYSSLLDIWGIMTDGTSNPFNFPETYTTHGVNFYDGSNLVGIYTCVLVVITTVVGFRNIDKSLFWGSVISSAFFVVLGWDGVWAYLVTNVPILGIEIYPFRFLHVAMAFILILWVSSLNAITKSGSSESTNLLWAVALVPTAAIFYQRVYFFTSFFL